VGWLPTNHVAWLTEDNPWLIRSLKISTITGDKNPCTEPVYANYMLVTCPEYQNIPESEYAKFFQNILNNIHWGQGPKYPLGTWWKHWEHSQHVTPICPAIKCWVRFEYTPLCAPDIPSRHILSTFWMYPTMWLQCTQWVNNQEYFQYSQKYDSNMPSG